MGHMEDHQFKYISVGNQKTYELRTKTKDDRTRAEFGTNL